MKTCRSCVIQGDFLIQHFALHFSKIKLRHIPCVFLFIIFVVSKHFHVDVFWNIYRSNTHMIINVLNADCISGKFNNILHKQIKTSMIAGATIIKTVIYHWTIHNYCQKKHDSVLQVLFTYHSKFHWTKCVWIIDVTTVPVFYSSALHNQSVYNKTNVYHPVSNRLRDSFTLQ